MTFDLDAYRRLIGAVVEGGYEVVGFGEDSGQTGVAFLRHDVDKSIEAALRIAEVDAAADIRSDFFFLLRSPLYQPLEPSTREALWAISDMGHRIGLHCDMSRLPGFGADDDGDDGGSDTANDDERASDDGLDEAVAREARLLEEVLDRPVSSTVSFHNPAKSLLRRTPSTPTYISTYEPRFMPPETKYLSDSNGSWREGDPTEDLAAGRWKRIQLLVHPIWWAHDEASDPITTLSGVLEGRVAELRAYLRWTNALWREYADGGTEFEP